MSAPVISATRLPRRELEAALSARDDTRAEVERLVAEARREAEEIRRAAAAEAEAQIAEARRTADEERRRVADEGALAREAEELADALGAGVRIRREFEALTPWLVDLVDGSLRRILGELAPADLTGRVVAAAVADLRMRGALTLRAAPEDVPLVLAAREAHPERFDAVTSISGDPDLPRGALVLDGAGGLVDVCVSAQIARLRTHLDRDITSEGPA